MSYEFNFGAVLAHWPLLLNGASVTLWLTFWATIAGFGLGTLCAIGRTSGPTWLRSVVTGYVEVIRNTPLLIQSYFLIFGMASAGLRMPILVAAIIALVVNVGAYSTEVMRAGIESIHKGHLTTHKHDTRIEFDGLDHCLAAIPRSAYDGNPLPPCKHL